MRPRHRVDATHREGEGGRLGTLNTGFFNIRAMARGHQRNPSTERPSSGEIPTDRNSGRP